MSSSLRTILIQATDPSLVYVNTFGSLLANVGPHEGRETRCTSVDRSS
jgi:hypothetical protein